MARDGAPDDVAFYEADPRAILPLDGFRVPRSVRRARARRAYEVRVSLAFDDVVDHCGEPRDGGIWLSPALAGVYKQLHRAGFAQSVECWHGDRLVGGVFGVALGTLFTSESMFHRAPDAGSLALVAAHEILRERGVTLWDVQMASPHVARFGAREITAEHYRELLAAALEGGLAPVFG
jgi:leucyl/phenylalanyl-tRNA--protein transferase